jgi:hypothetical protein
MRRRSISMLVSALLLAGCGSAGTFANKPRPATPVNLTVYINAHRVSVSPASVGAGPVLFIITNQATSNESVVVRSGSGASLADTGPINPGATAQVTVDFHSGDYMIATGASSAASSLLASTGIRPATLHIGGPRPSAANVLLQP